MSVNTLEAAEGPVLITAEPGEIAARSPMQLFWRRFRRDKVAIVALSFIVCLIVVAIAAPLIIKALNLHPLNTPDTNELDAFRDGGERWVDLAEVDSGFGFLVGAVKDLLLLAFQPFGAPARLLATA